MIHFSTREWNTPPLGFIIILFIWHNNYNKTDDFNANKGPQGH